MLETVYHICGRIGLWFSFLTITTKLYIIFGDNDYQYNYEKDTFNLTTRFLIQLRQSRIISPIEC